MSFNKLVYGKDEREGVVGIEMGQNTTRIYYLNGSSEEEPFQRYIIYRRPEVRGRVGTLSGYQPLKFFRKFDTKEDYWAARKEAPYPHFYSPKDDQMMYMIKTGVTMYKGMKYEDLGILSFDIETNGLKVDKNSLTYLISLTYKRGLTKITHLFSLDEYDRQQDMIQAFCDMVRELDPDVLTGHNILGFDLPFLQKCYGKKLPLGRDGSGTYIARNARQFRKDGHKSYEYKNAKVHGREIVDTMFLSMKYDFQNKYNSYSLKKIIEQEGLIKEGRQFYDAATIKDNWNNPTERTKIKEYCKDDSQDSLALCDLMLPNYFYYVQALPMGLQETILTASGSQLNSIMVRSYLQSGMSLPEASERTDYEGAISFGNPGLYSHVNKVDVASLYPSIILQYDIYNRRKDPQRHFIKIVKDLTEERLKNKQLAKETGDRYYKDLEQAQKILINSAYGFLGAPGLHFNSPKDAATITRHGREILQKGIDWVKKGGHTLVNVDTDSFSYTTGHRLSNEEFNVQLDDINKLFPEGISWENDGQYRRVIVAKAKNYVLQDYDKKVTIKGSGLKATMKEPALQEFIREFIDRVLYGHREASLKVYLYDKYAREICDVKDINRWCSRKNVTKAILENERANEKKIREAFKGEVFNEGDRIYTFFDIDDSVCLSTNFVGTYSVDRLLDKLFKTVKVFENIFDVKRFPNYKLKKNKEALEKAMTQHEGDNLHQAI